MDEQWMRQQRIEDGKRRYQKFREQLVELKGSLESKGWYIAILGIAAVILLLVQPVAAAVLGGAAALAVVSYGRTAKAIEKAKADHAAWIRADKEAEQQEYARGELRDLQDETLSLFESLPRHLAEAEKHMDQAEREFADGAFAPFWDAIEAAATALGHLNHGLHVIKLNASRYEELANQWDGRLQGFVPTPVSVRKLGISGATAERLQSIVRRAQRNFQFATIYEQRKTNKILVAGFTSLGQALANMTHMITASIDDLADSVTSTQSRIGAMMATSNSHLETLATAAAESAKREDKTLEMLDNIQRRRKPLL